MRGWSWDPPANTVHLAIRKTLERSPHPPSGPATYSPNTRLPPMPAIRVRPPAALGVPVAAPLGADLIQTSGWSFPDYTTIVRRRIAAITSIIACYFGRVIIIKRVL